MFIPKADFPFVFVLKKNPHFFHQADTGFGKNFSCREVTKRFINVSKIRRCLYIQSFASSLFCDNETLLTEFHCFCEITAMVISSTKVQTYLSFFYSLSSLFKENKRLLYEFDCFFNITETVVKITKVIICTFF